MLKVLKGLTLGGALLAASALMATTGQAGDSGTVLVTGANRGIGLEFARQYAAKGYKVIATARKPAEAVAGCVPMNEEARLAHPFAHKVLCLPFSG